MKNSIVELNDNPKEIDIGYFDSYCGDLYSKTYLNATVSPDKIIMDMLDLGLLVDSVLDVGCASGELVRDFRRLGVAAFGIENNDDILKRCVSPKYCKKMDIRDMSSLKDSSFDLIYTNALMYVYPNEILSILEEFHRLCREAVYLCNPYLEESKDNPFPDPSRVFLATETWWTKQFKEAGFSKVASNIYKKET